MDAANLEQIREWVDTHDLTLLVFTSVGCGVCDALRPKISELASNYPELDVRYVDVTESPQVAGQFEIFAVPVYVLSVKGREAVRFARHFGMAELEGAVARFVQLLEDK